jgi:hypothetical protein
MAWLQTERMSNIAPPARYDLPESREERGRKLGLKQGRQAGREDQCGRNRGLDRCAGDGAVAQASVQCLMHKKSPAEAGLSSVGN